MTADELDKKVRLAAFDWLAKQTSIHGDVLPRQLLVAGFLLEGNRVPLLSPQGIFKPQILPEVPLTITTSPESPYDDSFDIDGLLLYRYRGEDPGHRDNVGLRRAMEHKIPLIYFHGIVPGKYLSVWPVYIVGDAPETLTFKVAADDPAFVQPKKQDFLPSMVADADPEPRRAYITTIVRQRLHQRGFRERVLAAYREQCACCKLKHTELLDAAHIIADAKPEGEPRISNGIALCKLHHQAFDVNIIGIRPDYVIEVRNDVLKEVDGPMLLHGLQGLHMKKLILPHPEKYYPNKLLLEQRWDEFNTSRPAG